MAASLGALAYKAVRDPTMNPAGVDDRAFRLAHNKSQNEVDRASALAAVVGASAGAIFGLHGFRSVGAVASMAVSAAVAAHAVDAQFELGWGFDELEAKLKEFRARHLQ